MSRNTSRERLVTISNTADVLEVIREEQCSPGSSSIKLSSSKTSKEPTQDDNVKRNTDKENKTGHVHSRQRTDYIVCPCKDDEIKKQKKRADDMEKKFLEKEEELKTNYQQRLDKEIGLMKERFNFILQNEQIRASYMLREAHRERKEKIMALQRQLECKNLAGLMYVLASERRKSKLEIMRLTEQYTNYVNALQNLLGEGQALILHLSRGYKTAARVNYEWKQKMQKIMREFQNFVYHFAGGSPETNQYFFNMPDLLKIEAPLVDNPKEDPCDIEEEENVVDEESLKPKTWWEMLEGENRPFVMFGDMAEFQPSQRREVLRTIKAEKTAPKKWKEYVFNEMFYKSTCPNSDTIKDEYFKQLPATDKWDCQTSHGQDHRSNCASDNVSRRVTTASVDIRGAMGSILKIICMQVSLRCCSFTKKRMEDECEAFPHWARHMASSSTANSPQPITKATLLGARDSMEIASTTKFREKHKQSVNHSKVVLQIGSRKESMFEDIHSDESEEIETVAKEVVSKIENDDEVYGESMSALGSVHNDSLTVIGAHVPDQDHKINYEKVCPMEECQRLQVDSFIRSLPPYMRANPFTHFEQTYEEYEPCSPEQLEILQQRIEEKRKKEKMDVEQKEENPLDEWTPSIEGIAIQTSEMSVSLPPCNCRVPSPTPASSTQRVFTLADLIPVKQELDRINRECFFDDNIEFNRFEVIGQDGDIHNYEHFGQAENEKEFRKKRLHEIQKVLKQHPSLCEIFQANIRC